MACLIPTFNANSITLLTTKASTCAIYFTWEGGICWVREAMTRPWSFQILPNPYFVLLENNCPIEVNLETVLADEHEGTFSKIRVIGVWPGILPVRDHQNWGCLSKKRFGYFLGHLSFWVSVMELPLIFLYKNKKN